MRFMKRLLGLSILNFLAFTHLSAQQSSATTLKFEISIPSGYKLWLCNSDSERFQKLLSLNASASQVLSGLQFISFHQQYPTSHYSYLRNLYELTCANNGMNENAVLSLRTADAVNFRYVKETPVIEPLSTYTPNDYHGMPGADCSTQLDYINATTAWGITKGNPDITIGINDPSGFDINNPDLIGKITGVHEGNKPQYHGTAVAGCAAAHTDNGIGVAGIGFNCTLFLDDRGGDGVSLSMSNMGLRIINNSWFYGFSCSEVFDPRSFVEDELVYDEIYENGTSTCFAAGNGLSGDGHCESLFSYAYPGSLDHIITVGPVGHQNNLGDSATFIPGGIAWLWKDCHEESPGLAIGQYQTLNYEANDRVDISAPAYNLVSTMYSPTDTSVHYLSNASGTSFASPIVCGTLGLMLSANPRLSSFQLEYLLKTTARNIDFVEYPPGSGNNLNKYYVGKIPACTKDLCAFVLRHCRVNAYLFDVKILLVEKYISSKIKNHRKMIRSS